MEDESLFAAEKLSICDSGRSPKRYGSTCNHVRNNGHLVRHELGKTDTLQGIALKYGCTTEQIRRINRLFAQDSLFLRQHLMIPVDKESPYYTLELDAAVTNLRRPEMLVIADDTTVAANSASVSAETVTTAVLLSPEEESRKDIDAFLGKIDSTLAQTRKYVAKSQNSIDFESMISPNTGESIDNRCSHMDMSSSTSTSSYEQQHPHHQQQQYRNQHRNVSSSSSGGGSSRKNNNDAIELITMTSQSRRVQSSMHQHEQQQDDFFKL